MNMLSSSSQSFSFSSELEKTLADNSFIEHFKGLRWENLSHYEKIFQNLGHALSTSTTILFEIQPTLRILEWFLSTSVASENRLLRDVDSTVLNKVKELTNYKAGIVC